MIVDTSLRLYCSTSKYKFPKKWHYIKSNENRDYIKSYGKSKRKKSLSMHPWMFHEVRDNRSGRSDKSHSENQTATRTWLCYEIQQKEMKEHGDRGRDFVGHHIRKGNLENRIKTFY